MELDPRPAELVLHGTPCRVQRVTAWRLRVNANAPVGTDRQRSGIDHALVFKKVLHLCEPVTAGCKATRLAECRLGMRWIDQLECDHSSKAWPR